MTTSSTSSSTKHAAPVEPPGIRQERLMQITCQCNVEKNGYQDIEINNKDKNKALHVFRVTNHLVQPPSASIRFTLKYQKSGDTALEFSIRDIKQIFNQNAHNGMLSLVLNISGGTEANENNTPNLMQAKTSVGLINKQSGTLQRGVGATTHSGLAFNHS
jgi:hypothetical protein